MKRILHHIKSLRLGEVLLMTGFFMIGGAFSIDHFSRLVVIQLSIIFGSIFFLIVSIYSFNAFSGFRKDLHNPRLKNLKHLSPLSYLIIAMISLMAALGLAAWFGRLIPTMIMLICLLWMIYSNPRIGLKHVPFAGTALHFLAQILHFNLVYFIFKSPGIESLLISLFFACSFSAGHVHHEIIDYEADRNTSVRTGASVLGFRNAGYLSYGLFLAGFLIWILLFGLNMISLQTLLIWLPGIVPISLAFLLLRKKMTIQHPARLMYRTTYRVVFLVCGIIYMLLKHLPGLI